MSTFWQTSRETFSKIILFQTLYIPCFIAIVRTKTRIPAYQLMLILGILDLISLCINSLVTGYLAINGITFCQYPLFMFIIGAIAKSTWMTICLACILLAIERCVEVNSGFPLAFIFGKRTFRAVMTALMIYWVYTLLFNAPPVYIPEYAYYSFDPMIGKDVGLDWNFSNYLKKFAASAICQCAAQYKQPNCSNFNHVSIFLLVLLLNFQVRVFYINVVVQV